MREFSNIIHYFKLWQQKSVAIIIFLLIWEIAPRIGVVDPVFIPPISSVFSALVKLILSGELMKHVFISLQRAFAGYVVAIIVAIPLGFLIGWFRTFERYLDPLIQTMRQVPVLALFPVIIMLFGIGEISKIIIIAIACFQSMFLNVVTGVKNIDPLLVKCARSANISNIDMFRKVIFPASIPSIFTGLRYGSTVALVLLVAAEMLGAKSGLGYAINNWQLLFFVPEMFAAIVTLTLIGLTANYMLVELEKHISHWKEELPNI